MFKADLIECASRSVLCWLATSDADGMPNVSPKEVFTTWGNSHILIANISSPGSVHNIQRNPQVCVGFIDVFVQKGYKLKGTASVVLPLEADFLDLVKPLEAMVQGRFTIQSIIQIEVASVEPVLAPSYQFYGHEVTEATQIAAAMKSYGVKSL